MGGRRTNPLGGFADMMAEMNRMRELGIRGYETGGGDRQQGPAAWVPTADVFAQGRDLVVLIELAGIRQEDVEVTLHGGVLTVSGERKSVFGGDEEGLRFYARERFYGPFERSMSLPEGVDEDRVEANFEDGALEIRVRKAFDAPPAEPKRIRIGNRHTDA